MCVTVDPVAVQSEDAAGQPVASSGRGLGISEGDLQRFPGAVVEATPADPDSESGKLSGAPTASNIASHKGHTRAQLNKARSPKHSMKPDKEIRMAMMQLVAEEIDVAEIYSPPRVAKRAEELGLKAGWSLDLINHDSDGRAWDFSKPDMRARAINKIRKDKPLLIVGSPMCKDWSPMMNFNWEKLGVAGRERRLKEARKHLRFCVKKYKL